MQFWPVTLTYNEYYCVYDDPKPYGNIQPFLFNNDLVLKEESFTDAFEWYAVMSALNSYHPYRNLSNLAISIAFKFDCYFKYITIHSSWSPKSKYAFQFAIISVALTTANFNCLSVVGVFFFARRTLQV